jgi:catechol 2,3-dioxygenase-like lactoylglutathione lyase family enzyme
MRTSGINHVSIHANDLEASVRFYVELLDAVLLDTPNFGVPVQWIGLGETQLHVFLRDECVPQTYHHFAITVEELEPVYRRAEAMGAFDNAHGAHLIELPGDIAQAYVRDPAGNLMEINTPGASRLPEALRAQMRWLGDLFPQSERNLRGRLYVGDPTPTS